ncbi:MAG: hypothetical protein ACLGJB_02765 [Blastocatellia bacterium]
MGNNEGVITEPFGDAVQVTVKITPKIITQKMTVGDVETELHEMHFAIKYNSEEPDFPPEFVRANGSFTGTPSGPEWEEMKKQWKTQCDYVVRYLRNVQMHSALQVCSESILAGRQDVKPIPRDEDLEELKAWQDKHYIPLPESHPYYKGSGWHDFYFRVWWFARAVHRRLTGKSIEDTDSGLMLIYERQNLDYALRNYESYKNKWNHAKRIFKAFPDNWKEEIKKVYPDLPDDLLDAMGETRYAKEGKSMKLKPKHKPFHLAWVHCARDAEIYRRDDNDLDVSNWQTIRQAINDYAESIGRKGIQIDE